MWVTPRTTVTAAGASDNHDPFPVRIKKEVINNDALLPRRATDVLKELEQIR